MASDSLSRLRSLATEHKNLYKSYRRKTDVIHNSGYDDIDKAYLLKQHIVTAQAQLQALQARREAALRDIQARAAQKATKPSDAGRARVQDMLTNGWNFHETCQYLTDQGDREGLASLRAWLPFAEKRKLLPSTVNDAGKAIDAYEGRLYTDAERTLAKELQEVEGSKNYMLSNEDSLKQFFDRQMGGGTISPVETLWHWPGQANDGMPKGKFNPNAEE